MKKYHFTIVLNWSDHSSESFEISLEGPEFKVMSSLMWITRGSLMASGACMSVAYRDDGSDVVSYVK